MSLDQNLFTLNITPKDINIVDLIDPTGVVHYRKERVTGPVYRADVYDPTSDSLLATVTAPSATSKHKTIELHNPSVPVELKFVGTLTFRWGFKWEEHEFEWKREECFLLRKPDPPVLVAITREPPGRIKTTSVQILDYNINRFDFDDRKGLEIVILTALLTFQDSSDEYHMKHDDVVLTYTKPATQLDDPPDIPPELPPKPVRTGVERIAELQTGELNEITVLEEGSYTDYAQLCANLLEADNMLFITIRSSSPATVPKVLQVVEQAKRLRHKSGDAELHQYVMYDTAAPASPTGANGKRAPRIINLNDDDKGKGKGKYQPPDSLTIHMSKIHMPELQPKVKLDASPKSKSVEGKKSKEKGKNAKKSSAEWSASNDTPAQSRSESKKISKPPSPHVPSHKPHPYQPSPSPSQLNNPFIYAAPPPPHSNHPQQSLQPHANSHPYPNSFYGPGPYPRPSGHQQRSVSGYGVSPPPPNNAEQRTTTPLLITGLLDKLKTW